MALEHEGDYSSRWAAIESVAAKIGCVAQTLDQSIKQAECDSGARAGLATDERATLKALERENPELRLVNDIPQKAAA
jgi:transposase